jgi:D-xylose transport system permease protein
MSTSTPETNVDAGRLPQSQAAGEFALDIEERSVGDALRGWVGKLRTGDPGALPSILGLIVLALIFMQVSDQFLSENNIGNIPGQGAYIAVIALGLVFVLLLGEIDLSAGTAGGACAAIAAVGVFSGKLHGSLPGMLFWGLIVGMLVAIGLAVWLKAWSGAVVVAIGLVLIATNLTQHLIPALIAAVCIGAAIGIFNGYLVAKVGIPSFVVTLALFLAWQGVLQFALQGQPINTSNYQLWHDLTYGNLSIFWSWFLALALVIGYAVFALVRSIRAKQAGLARDSIQLIAVRAAVLAVAAVAITALASNNRNNNPYKVIEGIPVPAAIAIVLMIACTLVLTRTTWGRHLYATGGNAEAARRAGIDVVHMRVTAFTICSALGAVGGIMLASSQSSASLDLGSGNVLLFSVAAAVIGGTSLFGGRGRPRDAILGALVIAIIPNGLLLKPSLGPQWQQVITGAVLLIAAAVDAVSRRRAARS